MTYDLKLQIEGYDLPNVGGAYRGDPSRLTVLEHPDRGEVSFWLSSEDGNNVAYLTDSQVDDLYDWLVEYRKGRL